MTNHKVLIVEDERDLADLHRDYLEGAGYVTHTIREETYPGRLRLFGVRQIRIYIQHHRWNGSIPGQEKWY